MLMQCCHNCNTWHLYNNKDYYKCESCDAETFTEEWIKKHPEHHAYQDYLEYIKRKEQENGKNIKKHSKRIR